MQRGQTPSAGDLGVSPRFSKTPLGRVGGSNQAHVTATTPTSSIAHRTRAILSAGTPDLPPTIAVYLEEQGLTYREVVAKMTRVGFPAHLTAGCKISCGLLLAN